MPEDEYNSGAHEDARRLPPISARVTSGLAGLVWADSMGMLAPVTVPAEDLVTGWVALAPKFCIDPIPTLPKASMLGSVVVDVI